MLLRCPCQVKAKCSSIATSGNWCGAGKTYDSDKANTACAGAQCTTADRSTCCKASCFSIKDSANWCGAGKKRSYEVAVALDST